MKKETIEEAAQKYVEGGIYLNEAEKQQTEIAFYEGANWQAKRMYSEEDMKKAFQSSSYTNMLDIYNSFEDFIEQFKKK